VCSFVRKLVRDLREEIAHDQDLTDEDRTRLKISTIHTLARSLVERGGGTAAHPMQRHVQVIAGEWEGVVWDDVLLFRPELSREVFSRSRLVLQFHTEELDDAPDWIFLREVYGTLSQFYNAVGFADMIVLAREAVDEQPQLSEHLLWIVDEYQSEVTGRRGGSSVSCEGSSQVRPAGLGNLSGASHSKDSRRLI